MKIRYLALDETEMNVEDVWMSVAPSVPGIKTKEMTVRTDPDKHHIRSIGSRSVSCDALRH